MSHPLSNRLLESLPPEERSKVFANLEPVALPLRTMLFEPERVPRYVYLMTSGVASIVSEMAGGEAVEVGLVGREGVPGSYRLLGDLYGFSRSFIQVQGTGLRMEYRRFEQMFHDLPGLHRRILEHVQHEAYLLERLAACNRVHDAEGRLARWLLMLSDRTGEQEMAVTQEFLAEMLGTRRTTVTLVAGGLQAAGLLAHRRGFVTILDRPRLEEAACECYQVTQRLFKSLYR